MVCITRLTSFRDDLATERRNARHDANLTKGLGERAVRRRIRRSGNDDIGDNTLDKVAQELNTGGLGCVALGSVADLGSDVVFVRNEEQVPDED